MTKFLTHRMMIIGRWQRIALKITPFGNGIYLPGVPGFAEDRLVGAQAHRAHYHGNHERPPLTGNMTNFQKYLWFFCNCHIFA